MRKVIDYIPYELQNVKDYQQISIALESYFDEKNAEIDQLNNNRNILTSDEETIKMYENILNIVPTSDETLDERRYAIWLKMTAKLPYTEQWLRHWLTDLLGKNNYELTFDYNGYSFLLKISLSNKHNFNAVTNLLDTITPAHINYIITYLYNSWEQVKNKGTWQDIKNFGTWEDVLMSESF